jgi:hypothetical protein
MPRRSAASIGFPDVSGTPDRLRPPRDLSPDQREVFCGLVAASRPEHFRPSDTPLLSAYSQAVVLERASATALAAGDPRALAKWNGAVKALVSLSMRLRLSPQSRQPNTPGRAGGKPPRELSYYERQALQEVDHDGNA